MDPMGNDSKFVRDANMMVSRPVGPSTCVQCELKSDFRCKGHQGTFGSAEKCSGANGTSLETSSI